MHRLPQVPALSPDGPPASAGHANGLQLRSGRQHPRFPGGQRGRDRPCRDKAAHDRSARQRPAGTRHAADQGPDRRAKHQLVRLRGHRQRLQQGHGQLDRALGQQAWCPGAPGPPRTKGLTDVQSTNWSGYADTGSGFSKVTGSWTEPSASCGGFTTSLAAFWVGIDGYNSASVEQDGTLIECYFGTAYQYTWWEMYPANDIQVVGQSLKAGDSISSSVVRSGTSYTLKVTDSTHTA